jgi:hypothetical protein
MDPPPADDPFTMVLQTPASSPEWLAMAAYGLLIYLYLSKDTSIRTLSTVSGYTLLFLSKYLKGKEKPVYREIQTWGYLFVALGLGFDKWRDAFAVFAYGLAIADVAAARHLVSMVLALNVLDGGSVGLVTARMALIAYHI